tara:strand:+ start:1777 stop:2928 length:1152 start_codon:yes stop_codon:yes gene_type:complete
MVLTTTRKVGGKPLPFAGSRRIGMDLNMNSAMINIQGIISDDRTESGASAGDALINFGKQHSPTHPEFAENGSYGGDNNLSGLVGSVLKLRNISGTYVGEDGDSVTFTNTGGTTAYSATGGAGSTPTVLVNTTSATADQIATAVTALINAQYSADFTASVVDDIDYRNLEQPVGVSILMATTGEVLDNGSPYFTEESAYSFTPPAIFPFSGGATGTKKSAGDKAMDLYGILNNSTTTNGSKFSNMMNPIAGLIGGFSTIINDPSVIVSNGLNPTDAIFRSGHEEAYILGIQIPYNSMIQAGDGELYTARNFFMPTGGLATGGAGSDFDKTSDSNTTSASTEMDFTTAEKAGIQGSVQKMDITYNAGETVYEFNMIFAPVDNLL